MMDPDVKTANAVKPQDRSSVVDRGPCGSVSVEEVSVSQDSGQSYHIAQQSHFGVFTSRKHVIVENHTWVFFFFFFAAFCLTCQCSSGNTEAALYPEAGKKMS